MSTPYATKVINRDSTDKTELKLIAKLDEAHNTMATANLAYVLEPYGTTEDKRLFKEYKKAQKRVEAAAANLINYTRAS